MLVRPNQQQIKWPILGPTSAITWAFKAAFITNSAISHGTYMHKIKGQRIHNKQAIVQVRWHITCDVFGLQDIVLGKLFCNYRLYVLTGVSAGC